MHCFLIERHQIIGWALLLIVGGSAGCTQPEFVPLQDTPGSLDVSAWDAGQHGMISLDGSWAFYPNEFVPAEVLATGAREPSCFLEVPGTWHGPPAEDAPSDEVEPAVTPEYGTYHLRLKLPPSNGILALRIQSVLSAYDLWVGDQLVASAGEPGDSTETTVPLYTPRSALFAPGGSDVSLVIHVANFHHRVGGLYRPVMLGTDQQLVAYERSSSITDMFVLASVSVMAGYHLIHFGYRREEITSLYFALGCIALMIWYASNNEHLMRELFPALSGKAGVRLDYCSFFASVSFFALFTQAMIPAFYPKSLLWCIVATSVVMTIAVLTTSLLNASRLIPTFQGLTALYSMATLLCLARAVWCRVPLALYILLGLLVFIGTVLNDFMYSNHLVQTAWLSPFGLVFLVLTTSMTISVRFKRSFNHISHLKSTFERFVPKRFLLRITDEAWSEFQIGHAKSESIVVMFSDIRGFTSISESLSPEDLLTFLNMYFSEMASVVEHNHGFIDKFIGDGIMALFDEDSESENGDACTRALHAASAMQRALPSLNRRLEERGWPPIRIGIGVHYGPVVMGTVGAEFRMDSTVLGDTVNTAARLEGLAKELGQDVVVSGSLLQQLPTGHPFLMREIGTVPIRGKQRPLQVFQLEDVPGQSVSA